MLIVKSDLSGAQYGETFLVLTNKKVVVANKETVIGEYELKDVASASIQGYVGTCTLVLNTKHGSKSILAFTRSKKKFFEKIVTLINDLTLNQIPYDVIRSQLKEKVAKENTRKSRRKIIIRMLSFTKPFWHLMAATLALSVISTVISLLPPYLMKILIDEVLIPQNNLNLLVEIVLGLLAVNASLTVINVVNGYLSLKLRQSLTFNLRSMIYEKLQRLSLSFYDKYSSGSIISRVVDDVNRIQSFLTGSLGAIIIDVVTVVFIGTILFSLNPWLSLVALLPIPVSTVGTSVYRKVSRKYYHRLWRKWSSVITVLTESISANLLVRSFGKEREMLNKFMSGMSEFIRMNEDAFKMEQKFWPAIGFSFTVSSLLIWWIGGLQVLQGVMTLGALTAFTSYMWRFYGPISRITNNLRVVQQATVSGERIFEILDAELEVEEPEDSVDISIRGEVEFDNVWFTYDGIYYALRGVSLKVRPGEHVGIVGPSGSGKTTLVKLLLRLYEPQSGTVKIDGIDIRKIKLSSIKRQIAIVMQNPILFDVSIAENIALGKPNATLEEIIAAAKAAKAHDFIMKQPEAYDMEVGYRGGRLSGGERQRIAIAAAILKDPEILILDEPTSSLDAITEEEVTEAIDNLTRGRTTFIIAHRLSTLRNVDKIVVLDRGAIVEEGTHEELLKKDGLYKKLFDAQFKGFIKHKQVVTAKAV